MRTSPVTPPLVLEFHCHHDSLFGECAPWEDPIHVKHNTTANWWRGVTWLKERKAEQFISWADTCPITLLAQLGKKTCLKAI